MMRRIMFRRIILPRLVYLVYRSLSATWRKRRAEPASLRERIEQGQPFVVAMWHGDETGLICFSRHYHLSTMTSFSKDGTLMDYVLRRLGMATSRGSSSRGGSSALRGLVRLAREGWSPVITVDGPRGPVYRAKPGVLELARMTDLPVFPCALACSRAVTLKSWDEARIPLPFSRVVMQWGEPIHVRDKTEARSGEKLQALEAAINACREEALTRLR
jgi:lysophospholipid acyltransferase (LPLAT)-like uncharacterized protein